jgi:hypothetical protein
MSNLTQPRPLVYWRVLLIFTFLLTLPALTGVFVSAQLANASEILRSNWVILIGSVIFLGLITLIFLGLTWSPHNVRILGWLEFSASNRFSRLVPALGLFLLLYTIFPLLMLSPSSGVLLAETWLRWYLFWWLAILSSVLLKIVLKSLTWPGAFAVSLIMLSVVARVASYLPDVTSYPLSIGWSETSRYYDASLFFGQRIYGQSTSLAVLHPGLHLLLSVPFLFGNLPIWVHRFWMVFLTLALSGLIGLLLARYLALKPRGIAIVFAGWAFLFLMQGPIYLHLTFPVIIILVGFNSRNFTKSLVAVLLASLWTGISRINWFPVPAMLAAALYFIEIPVNGQKWFNYLIRPFLWLILGILAAFISQITYVIVSGGDLLQFYSSTSSSLLWYRLWPNVTYPPGIVFGSVIVSIPLWLVAGWVLAKNRGAMHFHRLLGLAAMLLVLFAGGLVVSIKIGGGGDLHNMDAYLIMLLLTASALFWGKFKPEDLHFPGSPPVPWVLTFFAIIISVWMAVQNLAIWPERNFDVARIVIDAVRYRTGLARQQGGEVLFIAERQLLTFGEVKNVPLVEEYERDFLTEMVMSHNKKYLNKFYQDLRQHRFALIIAETQGYYLSKPTSAFYEENDLWVDSISAPLLCEYKQIKMPGGYSYFVPRLEPTDCHFP